MQSQWELLLTNLAGDTVGALDAPSGLVYRGIENGSCEIEFATTDPNDLNHVEVKPHKRKIKAFRNGECVFWGKIAEPLIVTASGAQIKARDAFAGWDRPSRADYSFTPTPFSEIVRVVVLGESLLGDDMSQIYLPGDDTTELHTVQLKIGQRIGEFFQSLCSSNPTSGSWFRIEAQDDPDQPCRMNWGDGDARTDQIGARFEYGENTLDNVVDYEVHHRGLLNRVRVYYKGGHVDVDDSASIDEYGLAEKWFRRPGVHDANTASKIAYSKLQPTPFTVASFEPTPTAPTYFDDYMVGDLVHCYFRMGTTMHYKADDVIPSSIEVTVDDSGVENVSFDPGTATYQFDPKHHKRKKRPKGHHGHGHGHGGHRHRHHRPGTTGVGAIRPSFGAQP